MAWDNLEVRIIMLITTRDKHYFDEDNIDIGKPLNCHIAVNHVVQLTDEEKAEARSQAIEQYQREQLAKMRSRSDHPKKAENKIVQPFLFD